MQRVHNGISIWCESSFRWIKGSIDISDMNRDWLIKNRGKGEYWMSMEFREDNGVCHCNEKSSLIN